MKAGAEKDIPGRRNKSKGPGWLRRQSLAAWEKVRNAEKVVLEPFLSRDYPEGLGQGGGGWGEGVGISAVLLRDQKCT